MKLRFRTGNIEFREVAPTHESPSEVGRLRPILSLNSQFSDGITVGRKNVVINGDDQRSRAGPGAVSQKNRQARQAHQNYNATTECRVVRQSNFPGTANYSRRRSCRSVTKGMTRESAVCVSTIVSIPARCVWRETTNSIRFM